MTPFTVGPDSGELPLGQHEVTITVAIAGENRNSGNPNIRLDLEDTHHRWLTDWLTITPRAMWRAKQLWSAVGLPWPEDGGKIDENDLVGKRVHVEVIEDNYGRKVKEYAAPVAPDIPTDEPPASGQSSFAAAAKSAEASADDDIPW